MSEIYLGKSRENAAMTVLGPSSSSGIDSNFSVEDLLPQWLSFFGKFDKGSRNFWDK